MMKTGNKIDCYAKLHEYAAILRYYAKEYREIDNKRIYFLKDFLNDILNDLDVGMSNELYTQLEKYIKESQTLNMAIEKCAFDLEKFATLEETCPPTIFDFISSIDINVWWKQAYPIIEQIATITGAITGVATITAAPLAFIKWVRIQLQEKQEKDEYKWLKLILDEDEWNISILSQKLELPENETKRILKGFGYKWDTKKLLYIATENTHKLRNIQVYAKTQ